APADRLFYAALDGRRRVHESGRRTPAAKPGEEERGREDQRERVGDVFPGDVGRRTVRGLRHGVIGALIERTSETQAAGRFRRHIRDDVAEHVGGDDDVESRRVAYQMRHHGIDKDLVYRDIGKIARRFATFVDEHAIAELEHIALVHDGDVFLASLRALEGDARDPRRGGPRHPAQRYRDIFSHQHLGIALRHVAVGVEAFGVLPRDDEIELAQLGGESGVDARWPDIREEVEIL